MYARRRHGRAGAVLALAASVAVGHWALTLAASLEQAQVALTAVKTTGIAASQTQLPVLRPSGTAAATESAAHDIPPEPLPSPSLVASPSPSAGPPSGAQVLELIDSGLVPEADAADVAALRAAAETPPP